MRKQNCVRAAYYRGGTSRAIIFREEDLPKNREDWNEIFLGVIGSPDPNGRQLDGLGGGISSLSKICVVGKSRHPAAEVDYTFVQVGIQSTDVDYSSNCGNMSSAIGPFAVDTGLVHKEGGQTTVRIHNTNTKKLIESTFTVVDGEAAAQGLFSIDGVAGTADRIQLAFLNPGGSVTGKLMPTGNAVDVFEGIQVSCIDAGNPCVVLRADDLGIEGTILPAAIQVHPDLLNRLEAIRRQASVAMGLSKDVGHTSATLPKIVIISQPSTHQISSGEIIDKTTIDIVVRAISMGQPHRAIPITVAMAVAAATGLEGSLVHETMSTQRVESGLINIGHASGKIAVEANYDEKGHLTSTVVFRTARRLMDGQVYWKSTL